MPRPTNNTTAASKRKRSHSSSSYSCLSLNESQYRNLQCFQHKKDSLQLSVSQIAALTGFHPYATLPRLLMDLVYQGYVGRLLMKRDASLLGIEIVNEEEALIQLAKKGGQELMNAFNMSLQVNRGKTRLHSIQAADRLKQKLLDEAEKSKTISKIEVKQLVEGGKSYVNTGFGTTNEDTALDLYQKQCGWEVTQRNAEKKFWKFAKEEDFVKSPEKTRQSHIPTVVPMGSAYTLGIKSKSNGVGSSNRPSDDKGINVENVIFLDGLNSDDIAKKTRQSKDSTSLDAIEICSDDDRTKISSEEKIKKEYKRRDKGDMGKDDRETTKMLSYTGSKLTEENLKPFFIICGVVDGIRDELYYVPTTQKNADDSTKNYDACDDNWSLRQVIVECKHRMKKPYLPPPIYDQIQTVAYCMMYDTSEAEIVQVVRQAVKRTSTEEVHKDQNLQTSEKVTQSERCLGKIDITSTRLTLDEPVMQHRENWQKVILPRLRSFVEAVYRIRSSDDKRYNLIKAASDASDRGDESDWWEILTVECPWLLDCDIAIRRGGN